MGIGGCRRRSGRRVTENGMFMIGQDVSIANVDVYDANARAWSCLAPLAHPRQMHGVAVRADHEVLVFGGSFRFDQRSTRDRFDVERYRLNIVSETFALLDRK